MKILDKMAHAMLLGKIDADAVSMGRDGGVRSAVLNRRIELVAALKVVLPNWYVDWLAK